jgi:hypothetical protein
MGESGENSPAIAQAHWLGHTLMSVYLAVEGAPVLQRQSVIHRRSRMCAMVNDNRIRIHRCFLLWPASTAGLTSQMACGIVVERVLEWCDTNLAQERRRWRGKYCICGPAILRNPYSCKLYFRLHLDCPFYDHDDCKSDMCGSGAKLRQRMCHTLVNK